MNNTSANLTCKNIFNIILSDIQTLSSYRIVILQNKKKDNFEVDFFILDLWMIRSSTNSWLVIPQKLVR